MPFEFFPEETIFKSQKGTSPSVKLLHSSPNDLGERIQVLQSMVSADLITESAKGTKENFRRRVAATVTVTTAATCPQAHPSFSHPTSNLSLSLSLSVDYALCSFLAFFLRNSKGALILVSDYCLRLLAENEWNPSSLNRLNPTFFDSENGDGGEE
ncbi:hypothetical protein DKX38_003703 [Salix brachista]|uniref:Uncharacterized protein n=1 Tax=Salix brachista TaxID=2182728 RepID=A0A5N5N923_9ROSI|nr:hypothetical protein DKX38_003703 [Salix brachista]